MKTTNTKTFLASPLAKTVKILNFLAISCLFLIMILTVADVFMRKVFNNSIIGTVEVTELMMIITIFLALARAEELDANVKVDLILSRFSPKIQALFDIFTQLICMVLFVVATFSDLTYASMMRTSGEVSQDLLIPIWPFVYVIAIGTAMLSLVLFFRFLDAVFKVLKK